MGGDDDPCQKPVKEKITFQRTFQVTIVHVLPNGPGPVSSLANCIGQVFYNLETLVAQVKTRLGSVARLTGSSLRVVTDSPGNRGEM